MVNRKTSLTVIVTSDRWERERGSPFTFCWRIHLPAGDVSCHITFDTSASVMIHKIIHGRRPIPIRLDNTTNSATPVGARSLSRHGRKQKTKTHSTKSNQWTEINAKPHYSHIGSNKKHKTEFDRWEIIIKQNPIKMQNPRHAPIVWNAQPGNKSSSSSIAHSNPPPTSPSISNSKR